MTTAGTSVVELSIGGMTCASCAGHVEKALNGLPGVEATVNLATERAHVVVHGDTSADDLIAAVATTGYTASRPAPRPHGRRELRAA